MLGINLFIFCVVSLAVLLVDETTARPYGASGNSSSPSHHTAPGATLEALTGSTLINLTINWTIENFIFLLEETELRSPSVNSADIGLIDSDGDWQLILTPSKTIGVKKFVSLHLERANGTFGDVTGRFGFYVLDKKGSPAVSLYDESTNVFTIDPPANNWGYDKLIPHAAITGTAGGVTAGIPLLRRQLLVDGDLVIRAKIEFLGPMTINSTLTTVE